MEENEAEFQSKQFKCGFLDCEASFSSIRKLTNHTRRHTGDRPYICDIKNCNKSYTNTSHLIRHRKTHFQKPEKIICPLCLKEFSNVYCLAKHTSRFHDEETPRRFNCEECKRGFRKESELIEHTIIHTGELPFECDICLDKFPSKRECYRHKRTHTIYSCNEAECDMEFERWRDLMAHKKDAHQPDVKLVCEICQKIFANSTNLKNHVATHLDDDQKNLFLCPIDGCERFYLYKKNLVQHIKVSHEKIKKKIHCPMEGCTAILSRMQTLKRHMELHVKNSGYSDLSEYASDMSDALITIKVEQS